MEDGDGCFNTLTMPAEKIIIHTKYKKNNNPSHHHDIALIKLDWPLSFDGNINIRPVCLPVADEIKRLNLVNKTLTVTGFGKKNFKFKLI